MELQPRSDPMSKECFAELAQKEYQQAKPKYTATSKSSHKKRRPIDGEQLKLRLINKHKVNNEQQPDLASLMAANRGQVDDYGQN